MSAPPCWWRSPCWPTGVVGVTRRPLARSLPPEEPVPGPPGAGRGDGASGSERAGDGPLSAREREVARLVLEGKTYAEIGQAIFISPRTAEHHIARMRRRLGASTRSDLLAKLRLALEEDGTDQPPDAEHPRIGTAGITPRSKQGGRPRCHRIAGRPRWVAGGRRGCRPSNTPHRRGEQIMANITTALLDFLMGLLRNPQASAEFAADPDTALTCSRANNRNCFCSFTNA